MIQEATAEGSAPGLHVALLPHAATQPSAEQILGGVNAWLAVNAESISGASPVPGVTLPIGWLCTIVGEDTYVHAPALNPSSDVVTLRVPAHQIDTVIPEALGQPRCKITVKRVEEPGEDEPHAFMEFRIPATAWKEAPLGLPVIKLINAQ